MDEQNSVKCNVCHIGFPDKKAMIGHVVTFFDTISVPPIPENSPLESGSNDRDRMHTNRSVVPDMHGGVSKIKLMRMNPTRKRSERRRRKLVSVVASPPPPPVISSVSENFSDEEIARCLLRLSKDEWPPHGVKPVFENMEHEEEVEVVGEEDGDKPVDENMEHEKEVEVVREKDGDKQVFGNILEHEDKGVGEKEEGEEEEEDDDDDHDLFCLPGGNGRHFKSKGRKRYRCERCKMNFASYQALGGHKANHKRTKKFHIKRGDGYVHSKPNNNNNNNNVLGGGNIATTYNVVGGRDRIRGHGRGRGRSRGRGVSSYHHQIQKSRFECQFCDKVFQSGQALGGHKKVHYSYLSVVNPTPPVAIPIVNFHIDLNLPAALEVEHN